MERLSLDVYGVSVELHGDEEALEELAFHFSAFQTPTPCGPPAFVVTLFRGEPELGIPERTAADQVVDRGVVYNEGRRTYVDHHGIASSRYDFAKERGAIRAPETADLVELSYLMVHSRLGEHLERRGLCRLHCAGLVLEGRAAVILAPSGGGKSTLALAALRHPDMRLLGDDLVLIDRSGRALPFHSPLGVPSAAAGNAFGKTRLFQRRLHAKKWLLALDSISERLVRDPVAVHTVVVARRVSQAPSALVKPRRGAVAAALARDMVVGLGLPQVIELVARRGARDLVGSLPLAARRSRAALALGRRAQGRELEVFDPEGAIELLARHLRDQAS